MSYDLIMHVIVMSLIASVPIRMSRKVVIIIMALPFLGELVQFFMPSRTPSMQDALVGISAAVAVICLRMLYGEIAPVVRRYRRRKHRLGL